MSVKSTTTSARLAHCGCGCGNLVRKAGSVYCPGHDARHAGLVAREILGLGHGRQDAKRQLLITLPTEALRTKATNMVARKAAKPAKSVKAEAAVKSVEPVKVGRWTYPAMRKGGVLLRNTKRDGSGEWVAV